jgi:hypothetical protein
VAHHCHRRAALTARRGGRRPEESRRGKEGSSGSRGASCCRRGCQTSTTPGTPPALHRVRGDDEEARQRPRVAPRCAPPPSDFAPRRPDIACTAGSCVGRILSLYRSTHPWEEEEEEGVVVPSEEEEEPTAGRGGAGLDGGGRQEPSTAIGSTNLGPSLQPPDLAPGEEGEGDIDGEAGEGDAGSPPRPPGAPSSGRCRGHRI